MTVYAAFFLGQGGLAFSRPFAAIAEKAKSQDINANIFDYTEYAKVRPSSKDKLALIGYSLGVTAATYLQTFLQVNLLISVAASALGENYTVNHTNTRRSILYRGTDFLSSDGLHDGYDEVFNVTAGWGIPIWSHLNIPNNPIVINGILSELNKLKEV